MDCASIIFGTIRHHKHNSHLYSEGKALLALFTLSASFAAQKLSFIDHPTIFFRVKSVLLTVKLTQQNQFFFLFIATFMRT